MNQDTAEPPRERIKIRVKRRRMSAFATSWSETSRGRRAMAMVLILAGLLVLAAIWYVTPGLLASIGGGGGEARSAGLSAP
ncbi:MAG: hypothetical protein H0V44_11955 [Planctomycetes bacterium]|nr:hypothetical protein [Planctomycetota bacterium]